VAQQDIETGNREFRCSHEHDARREGKSLLSCRRWRVLFHATL
jgi:hypothetical protein